MDTGRGGAFKQFLASPKKQPPATEAAGAAGGTTAAGLAGGASTPALAGNTAQVGWMLYTHYLIPFEIASMLLLVAMIGAILLAKKEL